MNHAFEIPERGFVGQSYKLAQNLGLGNPHSHGRSNILGRQIIELAQRRLSSKWELCQDIHLHPDKYGIKTTPEDHLHWLLDHMIQQGVHFLRTSVDVGGVFGSSYLEPALKLKAEYGCLINWQIEAYYLDSLKLLNDERERVKFENYCRQADVIAGLPGKAVGLEREYIQLMLDISARCGHLPLDFQTDQDNEPDESETIILAEEVLEQPEFIGKVSATHAISLACQSDGWLDEHLPLIKEAGISIIITPIADASMRQNRSFSAPTHNSIAPLEKLLEHGINVCYGSDNIRDIYNPENEGLIIVEMIFLSALARHYNIVTLADIFSVNVQKAMGAQ